jgi:hypothetical protein
MRQLVVSEWVTLDGVFDADTMKQWFEPYDSVDRQQCITEMVLAAGRFPLLDGSPMKCWLVLAQREEQ